MERGKLTYTRKAVIARIPAGTAARRQFFKQLREQPEWLQDIWSESKRKRLEKLTRRQIDAIIADPPCPRHAQSVPSKPAEQSRILITLPTTVIAIGVSR